MRRTILLRHCVLALCFLCVCTLTAQVTTIPAILQKGYTGEVTIVFNPNEGNKGMVGATQCYAHTGITIGTKTWQKTGTWRDGASKYKMTKNADGNWELVLSPSLYAYYGVSESEDVRQLCFVFNDGPSGSKEGKTATGGDIFVDLQEKGLVAQITNPTESSILPVGTTLHITGSSTEESQLTLLVNGDTLASTLGEQIEADSTFLQASDVTIVLIAETNEQRAVDSLIVPIYADKVASLPEGIEMGANYSNNPTQVTLCTFAAGNKVANDNSVLVPAKAVYVVGDFNDWTLSSTYQMNRDSAYFWLEIANLMPSKEYAYEYVVVRSDDKVVWTGDAYARKVLTPDDNYEPLANDPTLMRYPEKGQGYVPILQTLHPSFAWSDSTLHFRRPDKNNLIIYELWIYDYTAKRNIAGLMERLDYLQDLGVNAVELMPICEFDGNYNWGYSPTHYFAYDKAYGTEKQLKTLIDECHKRGMAVILDMVFNHATGNSPVERLYPYGDDLKYNPWFNTTTPHSDGVYEDWNHAFPETRAMFTRALQFWLTEYKVDGFRMDLSHGFCGKNCNDLLTNIRYYYENGVKAVADDAYFILEHWGSGMSSQRPQLITDGMLCWNNTNNAYSQTAMGYFKDDSFTEANKDGYVSYCESHDEERNFYKAKTWGAGTMTSDENVRLKRIANNVIFNLLLNGPHMLWQYEEIGYDFSINSSKDNPTGSSKDYRCSTKPRPEQYGYFREGERMRQFATIAAAIHLRTHLLPQVFAGDPTGSSLATGAEVRYVAWGEGDERVYVVGNFSPSSTYPASLPEGSWYDYLQSAPFSGTSVNLTPGEVRIFTGKALERPATPTHYDFNVSVVDVESDAIGVSAYPTLTTGLVRFSEKVSAVAYSVAGQRMQSCTQAEEIDLSAYPSGYYLLRIVTSSGKSQTIRVVKQ